MRILSALLAFIAGVMLFFYPVFFSGALTGARHGIMTLILLGTCICVVHAVGYKPTHKINRIILHPVLGWVLVMGGGILFLNR